MFNNDILLQKLVCLEGRRYIYTVYSKIYEAIQSKDKGEQRKKWIKDTHKVGGRYWNGGAWSRLKNTGSTDTMRDLAALGLEKSLDPDRWSGLAPLRSCAAENDAPHGHSSRPVC